MGHRPVRMEFSSRTPLSTQVGATYYACVKPTRMESDSGQTPTCRLAGKRLLENCIANTYNVLDSFMSKLLRVHGGCLGARSR